MKKIILVIALTTCLLGKGFGEGENVVAAYVTMGSVLITIPNSVFLGRNIYQISNSGYYTNANKTNGIIFGTLQIGLGILDFANYSNWPNFPLNEFAYFDICYGSITIISSIWNSTIDHKPNDTRTSWNLYSFPAHDKTMGMGMSFSLRF